MCYTCKEKHFSEFQTNILPLNREPITIWVIHQTFFRLKAGGTASPGETHHVGLCESMDVVRTPVPSFIHFSNRAIMRTITDNNNQPQQPDYSHLFDEFLGIHGDFKVLLFAMIHQEEMPEQERGELAFTAERISDRMNSFCQKIDPFQVQKTV